MDRFGPLAFLTAVAPTLPGLTALSSDARAADADLAFNGGFESGLDGLDLHGRYDVAPPSAAVPRRSKQPPPGPTTPGAAIKARKANCGSYATHGTWPAPRGLMTRSINWDRYSNWEFQRMFDGCFG